MKCKHQWFELKKLQGFTERTKEINERQMLEYQAKVDDCEKGIIVLGPFLLDPDNFGVLVKCAECGKQKELWED